MPEKPSPPVASHPWIDFRLDLRSLDHSTWLALGECASKCRHIATTPLRPDLRRRLHEVYLAKGVRATTAIEGNTLSEEEVRQAVRQTLSLPPSRESLHQEVGNIIDACNLIGDRLAKGQVVNLCPSLLNFSCYNSFNLCSFWISFFIFK